MSNGERQYKVIGLSDHGACEFCGRTDLMRTVAFEDLESGAELHAGTTCAQTVKLVVMVDGEPAPRKAREILTLAQRADRERALAGRVETLGWRVAAFIAGMRADGPIAPRPVRVSDYTSAPAARGFEVLSVTCMAYNAGYRDNAIVKAARNWAMLVSKLQAAGTMAKREALVTTAEGGFSELIAAAPRTEPM